MASDDAGPDFTITVRCTACGEGRPVSPDPCPACGAAAYRDDTADDPGSGGDGDTAPFE
jgi:hypothetical protein